jgi:hypothetical protein
MSLASLVSDLATRIGLEIKTLRNEIKFVTTNVNLPFPAKSTHTVTIPAPGVTPASNIIVSRVLEPETAVNGGDIESVDLKARPGTAPDTMDVQFTSVTPIAGPFQICYARR